MKRMPIFALGLGLAACLWWLFRETESEDIDTLDIHQDAIRKYVLGSMNQALARARRTSTVVEAKKWLGRVKAGESVELPSYYDFTTQDVSATTMATAVRATMDELIDKGIIKHCTTHAMHDSVLLEVTPNG